MYNELIQLIKSFETEEGKVFWIANLQECEAVKGFLIVHFKLNR